ncbi:CBS domain-containing protein [bacterium]|nr:CBS domain-containing protein [bacterium]
MQLILTHKSPDADALASLLGAYLLFPDSLPIYPEGSPYPPELLSLYADTLPLYSKEEIPWEKVKQAILVDCSSLRRTGNIGEEVRRRNIPLTIIDHHLESRGEINVEKSLLKPYGSATTILVNMMRENSFIPSPWQATLLALGIYTDTGSLTYSSTTENDAQAVAYLISCGANIPYLVPFLHPTLSEEERKLEEELRNNLRVENVKGVRVGIAGAKREEMSFNLAPIATSILEKEDLEAFFLLVEVEGKTYIVGRSKGEVFKVNDVLTKLGGGGHRNAASAVTSMPLEEAIQRLLFLLPKGVRWEIEAGDIMSSPVRVISISSSVREALEVMRCFGFGGLPINERGKIVGVITRKEAERLVKYSMGEQPLSAFHYREPICVHPQTSLSQIIKLMSEQNIGRVLVCSKEKLLGIITRQDVINALYGQRYKELKGERIIEEIPAEIKGLLQRIGELAASQKTRAYLVGGVVRDMILGREVKDLDILVEGRAIEFARKVKEEMGGELTTHQRFGTATLKLPDGLEIDFATARREFYVRAGVLPTVESGSLREDLFRRDFTINALALSLHPREFGYLIDYFGGWDDLQNKRIRVLHSLSFWEDPTRILRAIRLEAKLGFKMDEWTENLARDAIRAQSFAPLSGDRLREELILLLEENPIPCLLRMEEIGLSQAIYPRARLDKQTLKKLEREPLEGLNIEKWLLFLFTLFGHLSEDELRRVAYRLRFTSSQREKLLSIADLDSTLQRLSLPYLKRSEIYEILKDFPLETIILIKVKGDIRVKRRVCLFLEKLRYISLAVNGEELKRLGIPEGRILGKVLRELFNAKLDGKIKTKGEEIEMAQNLLKEIKNG